MFKFFSKIIKKKKHYFDYLHYFRRDHDAYIFAEHLVYNFDVSKRTNINKYINGRWMVEVMQTKRV